MLERPSEEQQEQFTPEDRETFKKWVSSYLSFRRLSYINRGKLEDETEIEQLVRQSSYYSFTKPLERLGVRFDKMRGLVFEAGPQFTRFLQTLEPQDITKEVQDFLLTREDWSFPNMVESNAAQNYKSTPAYKINGALEFKFLSDAYSSLGKKMTEKTDSDLFTKEAGRFQDDAVSMKEGWYLLHHALSARGLRYPGSDVTGHRLFVTSYKDGTGVPNWDNFFDTWKDTVTLLNNGYKNNPEVREKIISQSAAYALRILSESRKWILKNAFLDDTSPRIFPKLKKIEDELGKMFAATVTHFG